MQVIAFVYTSIVVAGLITVIVGLITNGAPSLNGFNLD